MTVDTDMCVPMIFFFFSEPINTFHGGYKTDNEPIRLSYHQGVHYNSVVNPYKATIGVGLGLPGFQPGVSLSILVQILFIFSPKLVCLRLQNSFLRLKWTWKRTNLNSENNNCLLQLLKNCNAFVLSIYACYKAMKTL